MNVVCYEHGLLWTGLFWSGLLWMWSDINWSVIRTWSVMNGSVMNMVCYESVSCEQVCYERGLFWMVCYEWSVMNRSVLNGNLAWLYCDVMSQYGWIYWSLLKLCSLKCCNYADPSVHRGRVVVLLLRKCANHSESFVTGRQCAWWIILWHKAFRQAVTRTAALQNFKNTCYVNHVLFQ